MFFIDMARSKSWWLVHSLKNALLLGIITLSASCAAQSPVRSPKKAIPPHPTVTSFADFRVFMLKEDMRWEIGNTGVFVTVPAGFVTDLASVPQALWSFGLSPIDKYTRAAIIHDYLYWSQSCSKEQSDNLLAIAMKESDVGWLQGGAVYTGVVVGGQKSWDNNKNEFAIGLPKIAPPEWRNIPPGIDWDNQRAAMYKKGVRDPRVSKDLPYCKFGDSTNVPFDATRPASTKSFYNELGDLITVSYVTRKVDVKSE
ncbi:DUF1353 domain-containing protein [Limnohabitans sp. JirII-29]|uniref:DUF1353 domain-containing protein n=1 Tax=Limnohabitans sp. JirII-29 TaxID=1835756 RepID=UPI0018EE8057|nr:DUF1353 domain-containing protein [Limnohabitans sp. JirII-29]